MAICDTSRWIHLAARLARLLGIERADIDGARIDGTAGLASQREIEKVAAVGQEEGERVLGVSAGRIERRGGRRRAARRRDAMSGAPPRGVNRITSSRFHAPVELKGRVASVVGGPPDASIFFSLPCARNATKRESGDQNGNAAPSVPASGWATVRVERAHPEQSFSGPSVATNARRRPSGDSANRPGGGGCEAHALGKENRRNDSAGASTASGPKAPRTSASGHDQHDRHAPAPIQAARSRSSCTRCAR